MPDSTLRNNKLIAIACGILILAAGAALPFFVEMSRSVLSVIDLLTAILLNVCLFVWCYFDSIERTGKTLGGVWKLVIVLLGIFGVIIYLYRSRGLVKGSIATAVMLGFFLLVILVMAMIDLALQGLRPSI